MQKHAGTHSLATITGSGQSLIACNTTYGISAMTQVTHKS